MIARRRKKRVVIIIYLEESLQSRDARQIDNYLELTSVLPIRSHCAPWVRSWTSLEMDNLAFEKFENAVFFKIFKSPFDE